MDVPLRKTLQKETLDQSFDKLVDYKQFQFPNFPALFEDCYLGDCLRVEPMLCSRRATKVLQELANMHRPERQKKCRELYERAFRNIDTYSDGPQAIFRPGGCYKQYQVAVAVFATAEGGDIKQLCKEFDELQSLQKLRQDHLSSFIESLNKQKKDSTIMVQAKMVNDSYLPSGNFWMTALMLAAEQSENRQLLQQINQKHKTELKKLEKYDSWEVPMVHWNADLNWYDLKGPIFPRSLVHPSIYKLRRFLERYKLKSPDKWPCLDTRWGVTVYNVFRSFDKPGNIKLAADICKIMKDETP